MQKIVECVPNFSEGRNLAKIKKIADSAKKIKGVKVLDTEWDKSHNRSLVTIVGSPDAVLKASFEMIKTATRLIDMRKHKGEHPRIGATDVVPFIPVSGITTKECVVLSNKLAKMVSTKLKIPVYMYEASAKKKNRVNLADVRRGEYEGLKIEIETNKERKPDYGPSKMHPTAGAVVIGARKYLIAYNVNLDTKNIDVAKKIASKIREKDGGLPGVKALGFEVNGFAQISMNLVDFDKTNIEKAYFEIEKLTKKYKVRIKSSEIYGMIPMDALVLSVKNMLKAKDFTGDQVLEKRLYE
ncbi:MAG: glutamate formimidoyltransferase [Patescibacteria group bacterium]